MKKTQVVSAGIAFVLAINFSLHAQTTPISIQSLRSASASDLGVMLQALEATTPLPAESVPRGATFWSAQNITFPPLPSNINNLPAWDLGGGNWLLADQDFDYAALEQQNAAMHMLSKAMGLEMDSQEVTGSSYTIDTNGLWLEITGVSNGAAGFNLHNATNQVYAILSKTDLTVPGWNIEQEVWPGTNQDVTPFTVPVLDRTSMLFVRAQDWTGVDSDGDGIPDWWIWKYFGTLDLSATNLDGQGYTLLYDYQNGLDPNIISFSVSSTNQYANASGAPVQLNVTAGVPSYFAVLVDDTNYADASWTAYSSSNIIVNLGSTEGWHQVYVGLRGLPPNACQTWETTRLKLDLTPPLLAITNPTASLVTQPVIQLQGYSPEALASISYDLTNAAGLVTNQQTLILGQYYDTSAWEYTTNYFQCFDVPLTNGLNTITLHATDWAGNVTTTNFSFTLDYSSKTNPPAIQLDWPQAGTQISGNSFTWHGRIDDPTAQVSAQIVDMNGVTNTISGRVGRDGTFWIEDLPLSGGTNTLTLTVTDVAGNSGSTSIPVVQSGLTLAITSADLSQAPYGVSGTIGDTNCTIWVNGVQATNNGDGTWTVQNAHMTLDTPVVQARAIPNSDNGGNGSAIANVSDGSGSSSGNPSSSQATDVEKELAWPDGQFYISSFNYLYDARYMFLGGKALAHSDGNWQETAGGSGNVVEEADNPIMWPQATNAYTWPGGRWPDLPDGIVTSIPDGSTNDCGPAVATIPDPFEGVFGGSLNYKNPDGYSGIQENDDWQIMLLTGEAPGSCDSELFVITGSAVAITYTDQSFPDPIGSAIAPEQIQIGNLGSLTTTGTNNGWIPYGTLYAVLPTHQEVPVTLHVSGSKFYSANVSVQGYKLVSQCVATTPTNQARTPIGVGEQVNLNFSPTLSIPYSNIVWSTTSGGLSSIYGNSTLFTAPSNAATVTVTAKVFSKPVSIKFTVVEPTGIDHAQMTGTNHYPIGVAGAGMTNLVWIAPKNVSFYRVWMEEIGAVSTNATGYFADTNTWPAGNLDHGKRGANIWFRLTSQNTWSDAASSGSCDQPWSAGNFTWPIPVAWQVGSANSSKTNYIAGWNQNFTIDAGGTVIVQKFGHTVMRTPNDVITTP